MTSAVEFVDVIIAYEECENREVKSVRVGLSVYTELRRETGGRCLVAVLPGEYPPEIQIRGVRVWCDPTMPDDAGEAITEEENP